MSIKSYIFMGTLFFLACSCKDKETVPQPTESSDYLKVTMQPVFGNTDLQLDQTYTTSEGYHVQFTDLKCYLTSVKNGANTLCQAALFDFRSNGTQFFQKQGTPSTFSSFSCYLGVDAAYNHLDPSAFANDNPLNIEIANDMHWDWNPGYIFMKVEAKVDTLADGIDNFNHFLVFHVGSDVLIQTLTFSNLTWSKLADHVYHLPLKLDMQRFLQNGNQTIDLKAEHTSHSAAGEEALSLKLIQNFKAAISLY